MPTRLLIVDSAPLPCHISHTVHRHSDLPDIRRTDSLLSHPFVLLILICNRCRGQYLLAVDCRLYAGFLPAYDTAAPAQCNLSIVLTNRLCWDSLYLLLLLCVCMLLLCVAVAVAVAVCMLLLCVYVCCCCAYHAGKPRPVSLALPPDVTCILSYS